jgi:chemotaxis protein CheZ
MTEKPDAAQLRVLYTQIEEICRQFKDIRHEAAGIVETSQMPDAALHLNDVLKATEEATTVILDAAIAIGALVDSNAMSDEGKKLVADQLSRIYEASSFQDISGQRIKKVLQHLNALEGQLLRLSETASGQAVASKPADPHLHGPALAGSAPSQSDVDDMFKQA